MAMTRDAIQVRDDAPRKIVRAEAQDVPRGYKRTEVGVIPIGWDVASLASIAATATGNTPPTADRANYGDEYLFASPADLGETKYVTTTQKKLSRAGFARSRSFPKGSILFVSIGSTIGKCAIASAELATNQQINAVFPSPSFSVDYLYYTICAAAPRIRAQAGEQAVPIVNKTQFSATIVPLAQLPEQRAIAEALSDVDGLLGALEALIAKKRAIKQAAMQQLLTGKTRLPGFSGEWRDRRLADLADFCAGTYLPQVLYKDGAYDVQGAGALMGRHDVANIPRSLSVIGRVGTIGRPRFYPGGCWVNNNAGAVVARPTAEPQFVHLLLLSLDWSSVVSVTAQPFLVVLDLMNTTFVVPDRDEQAAIATVLSHMDAEIAALEARRDKTRQIKQGMMQQLLTGRVRLVKPEAVA